MVTQPQMHNSDDTLRCDECNYDLRAQPPDGQCPECGGSVAASREAAKVPRRPAWRDSDPRWRRRMVAGVWVLMLMAIMDVSRDVSWKWGIRVPQVFNFAGSASTLDQTLFSYVHRPIVFCIGVVLLFSKECGRRESRIDWTRRWGVIGTYVVLVLSAAEILFLIALASVGIAALLLSMPPKYQPDLTDALMEASTAYLRYGPHPKEITLAGFTGFTSITILLACVPLYDALRSSGPKWVAAVVLAPLGLFALMHLADAGRYSLGLSGVTQNDLLVHQLYFDSLPFLRSAGSGVLTLIGFSLSGSASNLILVAAIKYCILATIAVWLSVAQALACRARRKVRGRP
jgi:hypothetical protein